MSDDNFHKKLKELYQPPRDEFTFVDVPDTKFMVIEGRGDPEKSGIQGAMKWLYSIAHFLIPIAKARMGKSFAYPPIECLFWSKDPYDFVSGNKDRWQWQTMVVMADWMTREMFDTAVGKAVEKSSQAKPPSVRLAELNEGRCVQIMHVGDYAEVAVLCKRLYGEFLPGAGLVPNGPYHEIYLNDPNRTAPAKRKIVIRQPVKSYIT